MACCMLQETLATLVKVTMMLRDCLMQLWSEMLWLQLLALMMAAAMICLLYMMSCLIKFLILAPLGTATETKI